MKKRTLRKVAIALVMALITCSMPEAPVGANVSRDQRAKVEYTKADLNPIPDKYNTGATGELRVVDIDEDVEPLEFSKGNGGTMNVLDFYHRNGGIEGTVVIENIDFSRYPLSIFNYEKVERPIHLVFNNCKFEGVSFPKEPCTISAEFNYCTMKCYYGGNAVFNRCKFGQSYSDGMVPFQNVEVKDCFFYDMASQVATGKEIHTDGTQIYGVENVLATDISFTNCRYEVPAISSEESTAYVNACIMLQMEYSNADGIEFKDCIANGGGYSIYAWSKKPEFTIQNILFDGIQVGCAAKFGVFYSQTSNIVDFRDVSRTSALYVGSVWKEDGTTHVSVTNDTNQERVLYVYTDKGSYTYNIPACPSGDELSGDMNYEEMPFDLDTVIPADCEYVVCYDATVSRYPKQIRCVDFRAEKEQIYLDEETLDALYNGEEPAPIATGICGGSQTRDNVTYTLTANGVLILEGTGSTHNYHSGELPPWEEYKDQILEIQVGEGIERLGNQLFSGCDAVTKVTLPESLVTIGGRTFAKCDSLLTITLPASIQNIGKAAFANVLLQEIIYNGEDWSQITFDEQNTLLQTRFEEWAESVAEPEASAAPTPKTTPGTDFGGGETPIPSSTPGGEDAPVSSSAPGGGDVPVPSATPGGEDAPAPSATPSAAPSGSPRPVATPTASGRPASGITPGTVILPSTQPSATPTETVEPGQEGDQKEEKIPSFQVKHVMKKGTTLKVKLDAPKGAKITCKTSKKSVATINKKGVIKAKKKGTATVTYTATKAGKTYRVVVKVKVKKKGAVSGKITIKNRDKTASVTYQSRKKKVVKVTKKGKYTGKKKGKTSIVTQVKQNSQIYKMTLHIQVK